MPVLLKIDENKIEKGYYIKYFDSVEEYYIDSGKELESINEIKKRNTK